MRLLPYQVFLLWLFVDGLAVPVPPVGGVRADAPAADPCEACAVVQMLAGFPWTPSNNGRP